MENNKTDQELAARPELRADYPLSLRIAHPLGTSYRYWFQTGEARQAFREEFERLGWTAEEGEA